MLKSQIAEKGNEYINLDVVHGDAARNHIKAVMGNLGGNRLKTALGQADTATDPMEQVQHVEDELKKGDQGEFKDIPTEKRDAAFKEVENAKQRALKTSESRQRLIRHIYDKHLTTKYAEGKLTENDLLHAQNHMSEERFNMLSQNLLNYNMQTQANPKEYVKAIDFISDTDKNTERDCLNYIIKSENDRKLTSDEAHNLVKMFMIAPEDDPNMKLPQRPNLIQMLQAQEQKDSMSEKIRAGFGAFFKSLPFGHKEKTELVSRIIDKKQETNTKNDDLSILAEKEKQKFILEKRPDLNSIPVGKVKRTSDGHYGVKIENGWRDATTEEIELYKKEHGLI